MKKTITVALATLILISLFTLTVFAANEAEPNNSFSQATPINLNTEYTGFLSSSYKSEKDWYSFNIAEPGVISLSFSTEMQENNDDYWDISIRYGNNPDSEIWRTHVSGYTTQTESCKVGVSPGTYFVEIESGGEHTTSPYKMKVNYEASHSWEQEANGTWKTANPIELNKKYYGSLCKDYSDEKDWYSFTLSEPNVIALKLYTEKADSNSSYYDISIRDKDNPDSDLWQMWVNGYSTYTESCYLGLSAGTYYFEIEAGEEWTTNTYSFEIATADSNGVWEQEQNGTWRTATPVNLYEKNYGTLRAAYGSEQDWFSFVIPSEMTINLNFYNQYIDSSSSYWDVSVRDKDNPDTDLWQKHINGNQTNVISDDLTLSAGTYYVEIESANQWSTLPYYFVLSTKHSCGGDWSISQQPTCTETGKKEMYCNTCGKLLDSQVVQAEGHQNDSWTVEKAATCSAEGKRSAVCSVCGETTVEAIPMEQHTYGEWTITTEPQCHSEGERKAVCGVCGDVNEEKIATLSHVFSEWTIAIEATCDHGGKEMRTCSLCGDSEERPLEQLKHIYGDWVVVSGNKLIPPIVKEKTCNLCGQAEMHEDWSNIWITILAGIALTGIAIGIINYIISFRKTKKGN